MPTIPPPPRESKLLASDGKPAYAIVPNGDKPTNVVMTREYADTCRRVARILEEDKDTVVNAVTAYLELASTTGHDLRDNLKLSDVDLKSKMMKLSEEDALVMDEAAKLSGVNSDMVANCVLAFFILWEKRQTTHPSRIPQ